MDVPSILERVAERYRADAFDVIVRPSADDLPDFLAAMPVDLIARKGDRLIAVKADDQGMDEDPIEMDADFGALSVVKLLKETERLLHPETTRAALVMAWAAFEGAARLLLEREQNQATSKSDSSMVERLLSREHITLHEYARVRHSMYLRNAIVHGTWPGDVPSTLVPTILGAAKRLLKIAGMTVPSRASGASSTVIRKAINHDPDLLQRVERADEVLARVLGKLRSSVSVDWDIAREMRDRPVIVLRLSDSTGVVAATFEPDELLDEERLQARLNRLWGDLLEIRSHKQVERLLDAQAELVGSAGQRDG